MTPPSSALAATSFQPIGNATTVEASPPSTPPWQLYPVARYKDLQNKHGKDKVKVLHMVRHAEGTHNVDREYKDPQNIDARLTSKGKQQCESLAQRLMEMKTTTDEQDICVFTSPMTRCVQTALYSYPWLADSQTIPFVAHESLRETVNYNCDRRRDLTEIAQEFPRVDFSLITEREDAIWASYQNRVSEDWDSHLESAELHVVANRAIQAFRLIQQRPESQVVVCTHSAFLRCVLNWGQEGGVPLMMPQFLDERQDKTNQKLFEYNIGGTDDDSTTTFEDYMRRDYENCESRSFCVLVQEE
jgi:broad specificity phosphatase PhoE